VKSISLLIPPISVACIIVIYFWKVERNLGRSIRLYTGISFSLTAYLLALRQYLPPTMTFLEIVVLILILTSTLVFIYDMFNVTKKKG
jgi:hypothetical protein